uniref:Auxin-responsive protein n=1 Tax=Oryza meridionalis TaxID=40149 RepID=A0A0E0DMZ2_9ORYZ
MAWNGRFGEEGEEERGLELSLALPGYFSSSGLQGNTSTAADGAKGNDGFKTSRPAAPVVGWPPVRSFRRNLASSSSSSKPPRGGKVARFVKVNMDGVPIGRKVDLAAHGGYGELSAAVDRLFRGLLAAQRNPTMATAAAAGGESCTGGEEEVIAGLLDGGSGEYTLVYEDDEGDQMLVGDVPWNVFIAAARRLRVLRSSDLNASTIRAGSRKRAAAE